MKLEISKESFESRIFYSPDGCWLWVGAKSTRGGYGVIPKRRAAKSVYSHRASYILFKGEIPNGFDVCHVCDVPLCVNPDHLFLGTHLDNMRDMVQKGRQKSLHGSENPFALITEHQASRIKGLLRIGLMPTLISRSLKIGLTIVQNIKRGAWKRAPLPKIYGYDTF